MYLGISFIILTDLRYGLGLKIGLVLILYLEMATAAQMYNEMNFENHLMNQAYLHPGNSLGKFSCGIQSSPDYASDFYRWFMLF